MTHFSDFALKEIGSGIVEKDALGFQLDESDRADIDLMSPVQKRHLQFFRAGATYERQQRIQRELTQMEPSIVPNYVRTQAAEDARVWLDKNWWKALLWIAFLLAGTFQLGRLVGVSEEFGRNHDFQTDNDQARIVRPGMTTPLAAVAPTLQSRGFFSTISRGLEQ